MAMTQDHVRGLDQLRQRLSQLSTSIASLRADLERSEPLPTWPSLQSSAQALSFNLQQLSETFNAHRQFLREAHAYPLPNFPGHTQESLLGQLLRKKLEPGVEDWVEEYTTKVGEDEGARVNGETSDASNPTELKALWRWAAPASAGIVGPMLEDDGAFEDAFTIKEREDGIENVVTGLRRNLDGDDEEGDAEDGTEGDDMEDVMPSQPEKTDTEEAGIDMNLPSKPTEGVLRFMTTGTAVRGNS